MGRSAGRTPALHGARGRHPADAPLPGATAEGGGRSLEGGRTGPARHCTPGWEAGDLAGWAAAGGQAGRAEPLIKNGAARAEAAAAAGSFAAQGPGGSAASGHSPGCV